MFTWSIDLIIPPLPRDSQFPQAHEHDHKIPTGRKGGTLYTINHNGEEHPTIQISKMDDMGLTMTTTKRWKTQEDYTVIISSLHEVDDTVNVGLSSDNHGEGYSIQV